MSARDCSSRSWATPLGEWIGGAEPQVGTATYADKLDKAELEIDWEDDPAAVHRVIRVGGAWTTFRDRRLKINAAALVDGRLVPVTVQPEGKAPMPFDAWRNGARPQPGELFADVPA